MATIPNLYPENYTGDGSAFLFDPPVRSFSDAVSATIVSTIREDRLYYNFGSLERAFNPFNKPDKLKKEDVFIAYTNDGEEIFPPTKEQWENLVETQNWGAAIIGTLPPAVTPVEEAREFYEARLNSSSPITRAPIYGHHNLLITQNQEKDINGMPLANVIQVLTGVLQYYKTFAQDSIFKSINMFKNGGEQGGQTIPHPHIQLMALPFMTHDTERKLLLANEMYCNSSSQNEVYCPDELLLYENEHFISAFPAKPRFAFQANIIPKHNRSFFKDLQEENIEDLAIALQKTVQGITRIPKLLLEKYPDNKNLKGGHVSYNLSLVSHPRDPYGIWYIDVCARTQHWGGSEVGYDLPIIGVEPTKSASLLKECIV